MYVCRKHSKKNEKMYIGRDEENVFWAINNFARSCNVMSWFPELSFHILKDSINLSQEPVNWENVSLILWINM